jgi:RNA-directed DNA polymerase
MPPIPITPKTVADLARVLGVSNSYLRLLLRRGMRYRLFRIPKKGDGTREIAAPAAALMELQRRFLQYLETLYAGRTPAHGFVKGRSILSNARNHVRSRYVLNLDLENFFPSIHFGRVRGMFTGKPYFFGKEAAAAAANLCCRNAVLPQGAPTSPVIANMICAKLDSELKALAKKYHCTYTRYADDLTFSTKSQSFPRALAYMAEDAAGHLEAGDELKNVIRTNGFSINQKKLRLLTRHQRQEITGLTANRFPNIQRRFVRQIRAMLHAWRAFGHDRAQQLFWDKYDHRHREKDRPQFSSVVRGKIEFVGSVRGRNDPLYWRLLRHHAALHVRDVDSSYELKEPLDFVEYDVEQLKRALWVLTDKTSWQQSTAFYLNEVGLVSCSHSVEDADNLHVFQPHRNALPQEYLARLLARNEQADLSILESEGPVPKKLLLGDDDAIKQGDQVRLMGFPQHDGTAEASIYQGYVVNEYRYEGLRRFHISAPIIPGNSGGPVLDQNNRVIGVAIKGGAGELNAVVPVSYVLRLNSQLMAHSKHVVVSRIKLRTNRKQVPSPQPDVESDR